MAPRRGRPRRAHAHLRRGGHRSRPGRALGRGYRGVQDGGAARASARGARHGAAIHLREYRCALAATCGRLCSLWPVARRDGLRRPRALPGGGRGIMSMTATPALGPPRSLVLSDPTGAMLLLDEEPVRMLQARPAPAGPWHAEEARAWLRVVVEDAGSLYAALPDDAQAMYRAVYEHLRGPLLAPIDRAFTAQDEPAFKAALAFFDATAAPIRAAVARQVEARTA